MTKSNTRILSARVPRTIHAKLRTFAEAVNSTPSEVTAVLLAALVNPPPPGNVQRSIGVITKALGLRGSATADEIREAIDQLLGIGDDDPEPDDGDTGTSDVAEPPPMVLSEHREHREHRDLRTAASAPARKPITRSAPIAKFSLDSSGSVIVNPKRGAR